MRSWTEDGRVTWADLRARRERAWLAFFAWAPLAGVLGLLAQLTLGRELTGGEWLCLMTPILSATLSAFVRAGVARCPACGRRFHALGTLGMVRHVFMPPSCASCGARIPPAPPAASLVAPPPASSASPSEAPLVRYARERAWRVVHPRGIVRETGDLRVAVEHTEGSDARLVIDTDAEDVDLAALRASLQARVPSASAARVGALTRIEVPQAALDPDVLDDAVDAVAAARERARGAYR